MSTTANDAVRAELREALRQLSDQLLQEGIPDYIRVTDAVLHTWALFRLAELEEATHSLVEQQLESLSRDLNTETRLDTQYFAHQLTLAADRV